MFVIFIMLIPVLAVFGAAILVVMVKVEDRRARKQAEKERAIAELEYERAMQDMKQARLDEIEKELTYLEIKRDRLLQLYNTRTEAQQISMDDKIYAIDKKIDKLLSEKAML